MARFTLASFIVFASGRTRTLRPLRRRILDVISVTPGISISAIARRVNTSWPNANYHCLKLESNGAIVTRLIRRHRVCYLPHADDPRLLEARATLEEATAHQLATYLVNNPRVDLSRIIADTGLSRRVVYHHLKRFRDIGLIRHSPEARYRGLEPTTLLYNAIRSE